MISEVYNEDCMIGMARYPDKYFDLAVVDPPYGADVKYGSYDDSKENTTEFIKLFMTELLRVSKRTVVTSGVKLMYEYPKPDWIGCWYTPQGVGRGSHGFCCWQPILIYGKDPYAGKGSRPDSLEWTGSIDEEAKFHPCPKPIKIWKKLFKRWGGDSLQGLKVIDPFLGSGTSRIVADILECDFTGFELDKDYYEAQEKRWKNYKAQMKLF